MSLEFRARAAREWNDASYPFEIRNENHKFRFDWRPLVFSLTQDLEQGISSKRVAAQFHHSLVKGLKELLIHFGPEPVKRVVLSGGCFKTNFYSKIPWKRLKGLGLKL